MFSFRHIVTVPMNWLRTITERHPRTWLAIRVVVSASIAVAVLFEVSRVIVKHPNWEPFIRDLPDFSAYALAAIGASLPFLPELLKMLEDKKNARWIFASICFALAVFAIASGHAQRVWDDKDKDASRKQLTQILANQATHSDIQMLDQHMSNGFAAVIAAIKGIKPRPVKPPENPPPLPSPPGVAWSQARVVSPDPKLLALQVTIQSDKPVPASFEVECTGPISNVDAFIVGKGAYMDVLLGTLKDNPNTAIVKIGFPLVTPQTPLVITILSKENISAVGIKPYQQ